MRLNIFSPTMQVNLRNGWRCEVMDLPGSVTVVFCAPDANNPITFNFRVVKSDVKLVRGKQQKRICYSIFYDKKTLFQYIIERKSMPESRDTSGRTFKERKTFGEM